MNIRIGGKAGRILLKEMGIENYGQFRKELSMSGNEVNPTNILEKYFPSYSEKYVVRVVTAKKKENSAAAFRVSFWVSPPIMVAAERDTPGIMAIT